MKNVLGIVLLMLVGGIASGYISSTSAASSFESHRLVYPVSTEENGKSASATVFPVAGKKARIGSFWGAVRDGGSRKHEGVDIFAAKKTPVLAVADGIITTIGTGGRGGKYIWLKSLNDRFTYYYAHLDHQKVKAGDIVKAGQAIGTVGNTGNAKLTPPHLHFGMYSYAGAVDPLPYVKNLTRLPIPDMTGKSSTATAKDKSTRKTAALPFADEKSLSYHAER